MIPWVILAVIFAGIDWLAVARGWKKLEYTAKPGVMLFLLIGLVFLGGTSSSLILCFEAGIFLSLVGDVFLMVSYVRYSNRWFLAGLVVFLMAHLAYIIGLNIAPSRVSPVISVSISIVLAFAVGRILGRIVSDIRQKGLRRMELPIIVYGMVITIMLLSAVLTLTNVKWSFPAPLLVALGALLFYLSDIVLAWNKFSNPIRNGRLINIILYHLGQITLIVGVLLQTGSR